MSLYTPVFPSIHDSDSSRKGPPENSFTTTSGKKQNYVEFLRDVHLFLSTQSDMLSPPSRPSSPFFDRRVQKVKDEVKNVFNTLEGDAPSGKWTRVNQTLKLGCVRGRHWSATAAGPSAPEQDTTWILPDEESEWIDWEKKREENRRLKTKTNASQHIGTAASFSQKTNHASVVELTQPFDNARQPSIRDVSPTTLRAAKEKVRKWQASVTSEAWQDTATGSSARAGVAATKGKADGPQRSRTLDFAVMKPTAKLIIGNKGKGSLPHPGIRGGSAPIVPLQKSKSFTPSKPANAPGVKSPVDVCEGSSKQPPVVSPAKDDMPKIADVPETPYLPPSFPAHLETSTPLPDSAMIIRTKPSPILPLPASSSMPLPSASVDPPPSKRQLGIVEPHAVNPSSCLPPQINAVQVGKRSRAPSTSLDEILNDPSVNPPSKRLRTLSEKPSTPSTRPSKPNEDLDVAPCIGDGARDLNRGTPSSRRHKMDTTGAPSTPGKNDQPVTGADAQGLPERLASPTKSVKSFFSAPDSDAGDSPLKANLLLESPVSPMLSYAQKASSFLPLLTSTQVGKESPSAGRTSSGMYGMGFSSQFDVEKHVDRVSEMLEKDVDLDGWLEDVRTVETGHD